MLCSKPKLEVTLAGCLTLKEFSDPNCALYNVQLAFPQKDGTDEKVHQPTLSNMVKGRPIHADVFMERIPFKDIPTDSEEEINQFLIDLYLRKDKLMDHYLENGKFPGKQYIFNRRRTPFINWLLWFIPISFFAVTSLWCLVTSGNTYLISLGIGLITIGQ